MSFPFPFSLIISPVHLRRFQRFLWKPISREKLWTSIFNSRTLTVADFTQTCSAFEIFGLDCTNNYNFNQKTGKGKKINQGKMKNNVTEVLWRKSRDYSAILENFNVISRVGIPNDLGMRVCRISVVKIIFRNRNWENRLDSWQQSLEIWINYIYWEN